MDPVRYISNRSSGKMGYAVATEALQRGHEVRLVSGPVALPQPPGAWVVRVQTAAEMLLAVSENVGWCEVLIMAAAVADWRPVQISDLKMKKADMMRSIQLAPNPDILTAVRPRKGDKIFVGFAAETGDPLPEAKRKLADKGLDLIVANDVLQPDAGFEVDTNRMTLLSSDGSVQPFPLMSKTQAAAKLLDWVESTAALRKAKDPSPSKAI